MAGAGYKLFNTGDVLTAAQVNTYLMEQTVMAFADAAARTSALSGVLAEGMVSYLKDTNTLEVYDGSAWVGATGDITGLTAGTGISISSATGPVPTITNDVATEFDAKGDLVVGTGADAFDKLSVGNDGETLLADSAASTGLRWQPQFLAGKNKIINGDFGIWQRGTSFSAGSYNADRFLCTSDAAVTVSRETFTPGSAPVAGYEGSYFCRLAKSAGGTFLTQHQRIEDVRTFAGQTITLSFWARVSSGTLTIEPYYEQLFGSGGSATVGGAFSSATLTTTWTRYSFTLTLPSISGKTIGTSSSLYIYAMRYIGSGATTIDLWGVQVEAGSVATPFSTATGTLAGEYAACMRYFYRMIDTTAVPVPAAIYCDTTSRGVMSLGFPVPMRVAPAVTATASNFNVQAGGSAATVCSSFSTFDPGTKSITFVWNVATTPFTIGHGGRVTAIGSGSPTLDFSAEL